MSQPDPEAPPPPEEEAVEELNLGKYRTNGCVCPWYPLQFVGWFFVIFFAVAHFGFLVFYVPGYWRIPVYIIPGLILLIHAIATIVTTAINPAEREVRNKGRPTRTSKFNPATDGHVIQDRYCQICEVYVSERAKHCRVCNKCVEDFDHHCIWLNNCIGSRNYRWFFTTILTAFLGAALLTVYSSSLFVVYFVNQDLLRYNCPHDYNLSLCDPQFRIFGAAMPHQVFPVLVAVIGVLSAIATLLDGHLTAFHIRLKYKGISTYDQILINRERELNTPPRPSLFRRLINRLRKNRIVPSASHLNNDPNTLENDPRSTDNDLHAMEEGRLTPLPTDQHSGSLSNVSRGSVGMDNFGRTPLPSVGSHNSLQHGLAASWTHSDSYLPNDPTVIELDPMPRLAHPEKLAVFRSASTGDLRSGSTLSFMIGDHSSFERAQTPPPTEAQSPLASIRVMNAKRTSSSFSSFIVLDMPRSLSASHPLPPIGSAPSDLNKSSKKQSKKLKAPRKLPALRTKATSSPCHTGVTVDQLQDNASVISGHSSGQGSDAGTFV